MGRINYTRLDIDLTVVRSAPGATLLPTGTEYDAISVLEVPVGAGAELIMGEGNPSVLLGPGDSFEFTDECGNPFSVTEGLRLTNPAGAGFLRLLISLGSPGVSRGV